LKAFSGEKNFNLKSAKNLAKNNINPSDYAQYVPELQQTLKAYNVSGRVRSSDTEIKILEQVVQSTQGNPSVFGKVTMIGNRETCYSCQKVALDFRKIRPNIEIEIVYTAREANPLNLMYNGIRNSLTGLRMKK
jgi:hypothetical protein